MAELWEMFLAPTPDEAAAKAKAIADALRGRRSEAERSRYYSDLISGLTLGGIPVGAGVSSAGAQQRLTAIDKQLSDLGQFPMDRQKYQAGEVALQDERSRLDPDGAEAAAHRAVLGRYAGGTLPTAGLNAKEAERVLQRTARPMQSDAEMAADQSSRRQSVTEMFGRPLPFGEMKQLTEWKSQVDNAKALQRDFSDDFAGMGPGGPLVSTMAQKTASWAPEKAQRLNAFWSNVELLISLPLRHESFGATLTGHELDSWNRATSTLKSSANPAQVRNALKTLETIAARKLTTWVRSREAQNFRGLREIIGDPGNESVNPEAPLPDIPSLSGSAPKRASRFSAQELEALRQQVEALNGKR